MRFRVFRRENNEFDGFVWFEFHSEGEYHIISFWRNRLETPWFVESAQLQVCHFDGGCYSTMSRGLGIGPKIDLFALTKPYCLKVPITIEI